MKNRKSIKEKIEGIHENQPSRFIKYFLLFTVIAAIDNAYDPDFNTKIWIALSIMELFRFVYSLYLNTRDNTMARPKKLIRSLVKSKLKEGEWEIIYDDIELNQLYAIKVREELAEIQKSKHSDIMEFVDLIQVAYSFANENGFTPEQIENAGLDKSNRKGDYGRLALNNLNPANSSNRIYFEA